MKVPWTSKRKFIYFGWLLFFTLPLLLWKVSSVGAQEGSFYEGKTIRVVVCCTPGGFYDRWARLLARYMPTYIPGNPNMIVQNRPGAGSVIAANYVYNVAKQDGITILMPLGQIYMDQLVGTPEARFDVRKLQWIGTQEVSSSVLYTRADAPYATIEDILKASEPPKCGSTGVSSAGHLVPRMLELATGAKFKIVSGYPGGSEIDLSVERGEINCRGMTLPPHMGREPFITWHKKDFDRHVVQTGKKRDNRLPDTPTIYEIMDRYKTPEITRRVVRALAAGGDFGRPFAVGPGVPADRVKILRQAYTMTLKDPKLLAEAEKGKMDVDPSTGEQVQALANEILNQPAEVINKIKELLGK